MTGRLLVALALALGAASVEAELRPGKVGTIELALADHGRGRSLPTQLWYPAAAGAAETELAYERAFKGRAAVGAAPDANRHPLVLLSHGDKGGKSNQSWLAEVLAANGYVVAAVDHWQNTRHDATPEGTLRVWERPQDLSFVLSALLADAAWAPRIDATRVGAAGHSSGGYTALALVGARYRPLQMGAYCAGTAAGPDCTLARGARLESIDFTPADRSWRDDRVRAAFAMAPALGPGMDAASLKQVGVPVQIVAAHNDEVLPFAAHAAHYAALIPGARLLTLPDGGHFAFMPECTLPATLFTWFHTFDICGRRHAADRATLHATTVTAALRFFGQALAPSAASRSER